MCRFVLGRFVGLGFCFVRAGNAFWSLLLQLAAQVLAPGVGDVASALTSRAASAVGRLSPKEKLRCFFMLHYSRNHYSTIRPWLDWSPVSEDLGHPRIL